MFFDKYLCRSAGIYLKLQPLPKRSSWFCLCFRSFEQVVPNKPDKAINKKHSAWTEAKCVVVSLHLIYVKLILFYSSSLIHYKISLLSALRMRRTSPRVFTDIVIQNTLFMNREWWGREKGMNVFAFRLLWGLNGTFGARDNGTDFLTPVR